MNKFLILARVISVSLFVFGCGGTDEDNNKDVEDLARSQCSVQESPDGEQSVIRCTDGSMAIIKNGRSGFKGEDGQRGQDGDPGPKGDVGESCSVRGNQDGSYTITCADGEVTLNDGKDGGSCTIVVENEKNMLKCDDGTSLDLGAGSSGSSCSILKGNLTIENQIDLDAFAEAGCTSLTGDLRISVADVDDISALQTLTSIGGELHVVNNKSLVSLAGLHNITSVGGQIVIDGNDALTSLASLTKLGQTNAVQIPRLVITHNQSLISLQGLENIVGLEQLTVSNNAALTTLTGLSGLTQVSHSISIELNDSLTSIQALSNVSGDLQSVRIVSNSVLGGLGGLSGLQQIDVLIINQNNTITTLSGLSPSRVLTLLEVRGNRSLTSLQGLEVMDYTTPNLVEFGTFLVENNDALVSIAALGVLNQMAGDMIIRNNPNLTTFWGDFEGPSAVRNVVIEGNDSLLAIPPMTSLAIAKDVRLLNNDSITEVGFSSLYEVDTFEVRGNNSLDSPTGSMNLFESKTIIIEDNSSLSSLSWLPPFFVIRERLRVVNNIGLDPCLVDNIYNAQPPEDQPSLVQSWGNTGGMGFCP